MTATDTKRAPGMYELALDDITPAADNIREDLGDLTDLTESIRQDGVLEPVVVTTTGILVAGHRRHAAAREAGLEKIPAVVREFTEAQRITAMLAENLHRTDITPLEEAKGYQALLDLAEVDGDRDSAEHIAAAVGVRPQRVKDRLALAALPQQQRVDIVQGVLSIRDALTLARLAGHPTVLAAAIKNCRWARSYGGGSVSYENVSYQVEERLREIRAKEKREKAVAKLPKGTKLVALDDHGHPKRAGYAKVVASPGYGWHRDKEVVADAKAHAKLDCHALALDREGRRVELCSKPANHRADDEAEAQTETSAEAPLPPYEVWNATTEAREEAMRRVVQVQEESFGAEAGNPLWERLREHLLDEMNLDSLVDGGDAEKARPSVVLAAAAMYLLEDDARPIYGSRAEWFDDEAQRYYALLEAHDYTLSDDEQRLRAAAAGVTADEEAAS